MTKKVLNLLNIVYDASFVASYKKSNRGRTGIFFVAFNILSELLKRAEIRVFVYIDPIYTSGAKVLQKEIVTKASFIFDYSNYPKLSKVNDFFEDSHTRNYHSFFLRKIFGLGMIVTRFFLKKELFKSIDDSTLPPKFVYLSPAQKVPDLFRSHQNVASYIILYDAIPFLFPEINPYKSTFDGIFDNNFISREFFFCISHNTLLDFKKLKLGLDENNASVINLAANENFKEIKDDVNRKKVVERYSIPRGKKYIFSLCTLEPRKNLVRAIRCFMAFIEKHQINDLVWVMGGGQWDFFVQELKKEGVRWDSKYVIQAGYTDDEDLPILYSNAEWFVYTSQYEGFGLPPLEAMQCGCPVITSNNSSLPEVIGDAGIMIDWDSDEQHIEAYEKYYFDENLRNENSRKGIERAKFFSWKKTVEKMISEMKSKSRTKKHLDNLP